MLYKYFKYGLLLLSLATISMGCSSKEDSAPASGESLVISGSLNAAASNKLFSKSLLALSSQSIDVSELEIYGLAFSDPPEVQTVELESDGSFTLTFSSAAAGAPISLIFRYKSTSAKAGEQVGVVKFVDDSEKDIDGDSSSSSSIALSGTVSLGNLNINDDGEVEVPVTQISSNIANKEVDSSSGFNFTGNWIFKEFDKTLPSGYSQVCAANDNNCNGPAVDMPIHLVRIDGKKYNADSTCQAAANNETFDADSDTCGGTTGSEDKYMIQVWQSETARTTCGGLLGFKNEAAKAYANIDFSSSGVTEGEFTWSAGFTDGWKATNATSSHDQYNCGPAQVTDSNNKKYQGWKCTDTSGDYQINLEGGCVDANNQPVHVTDWENITPDNCNSAAVTGLTGYQENTCVYTNEDPDGAGGELSAMNFTCKHIYGQFDSDDSPDTDNSFDWSDVESNPIVANGANCSSITANTDEKIIAQLQCYADYLWQQNLENDDSKCIRRVELNWGATDPNEFVLKSNGPPRAMTLFVLSKFNYDSSSSGYFEDGDVYYRGIQTGDSWTNCKVKENFRMTFKKRDSSTLVGEMVQEMVLLDTGKEACVAAKESSDNELEIGSSKSLMLLKKQ
ncbi:MAG: hypothetical protein KDD58_09940 [Bdellovibrionales bacterium]|nr:hypothetical protein [Bdellovibrionales bacterium]